MVSTKSSDECMEKTSAGEASPEQKMKELEEELAKKTTEAEDNAKKAIYLQADYENLKKRAAKEKEEYIRQANESLILELIDIYENLGRAADNARKAGDEKISRGIDMIFGQMRSVLEKHGLKEIKSAGEAFDPYLHEAVMQGQSDEHEDGTVLEEYQKGYTLNTKVIRYSKVKVSKR